MCIYILFPKRLVVRFPYALRFGSFRLQPFPVSRGRGLGLTRTVEGRGVSYPLAMAKLVLNGHLSDAWTSPYEQCHSFHPASLPTCIPYRLHPFFLCPLLPFICFFWRFGALDQCSKAAFRIVSFRNSKGAQEPRIRSSSTALQYTFVGVGHNAPT